MLATMRFFFVLAVFCLVGWSNCHSCPARYKRFTPKHTFCLAPNPQCHIKRTGVSEQDKELILKLHNERRSKVAMGKEDGTKGGDSLPQAADMMQMEWDNELAAVAQKWTQNCIWGHDCPECKAVENFDVGQNIHMSFRHTDNEPDWTTAISKLYAEVKDYHTSWLASYTHHDGPMTGHFTQLIWAKSFKVGCGYSFYKIGGQFQKYYACNYGNGGNVDQQSVYKQGPACSFCPTNTKCSTSSTGGNSFPGLCKLNNPNEPPAFRVDPQGLLFYCTASSSDPDCKSSVSGDGSWGIYQSVGGYYYSIVLKGGQSATLSFSKPIIPNGGNFCLDLNFRKGPLDASNEDQSSFQPLYKMDIRVSDPQDLNTGTTIFMNVGLDIPWGDKTKISFKFSVPRGAGPHVLDIRKIMAFDGGCSSRNL